MAKSIKAQPVVAEPVVEAGSGIHQPRDVYCLLVNDAVSVETHSPSGDWYCRFEKFSGSNGVSAFYPMLVNTHSGQRPLSGFQQLDTLRSIAEYMYKHLSEQQPVELSLVSGNHKMMSVWISAE